MSDYTDKIESYYWGYIEHSAAESEYRLQNLPDTASKEDLKKELDAVREKYTCSARRALMKYLEDHAVCPASSTGKWQYQYQNETFSFHPVTEERILGLDKDERDSYIRLLTLIASDGYQNDYLMWRTLMRRAMLRNKELALLTREEGFRIAHALRFSLKEAEEFLVRVLDNDGFCYTRSDDLIEAFCFLYPPCNNWKIAQELKQIYQNRTAGIPKLETEEKADNFTQSVFDSLKSKVEKWQIDSPDNVAGCFMDWLCANAPALDLPGKSAFRVYHALALIIYKILNDELILDDSADIHELIKDDEWNDLPDGIDEYQLTEYLFRSAKDLFEKDSMSQTKKMWRYVTVNEQGAIALETIGEYIPLLLTGKRSVTKADLLFLIWYICVLTGEEWNLDKGKVKAHSERLNNFWNISESLLKKAHLPIFYAPHPLEQCFLMSICMENVRMMDAAADPFLFYKELCELVLPEKKTRNRTASQSYDKKNLERMRQEVRQQWKAGMIGLEGLSDHLLAHLFAHAASMGQYVFTPDGICYYPNPAVVISYPNATTGERFDLDREDYQAELISRERFRFLYSMTLYLKEEAKKQGYITDFRVNYKKQASLKILKWERQESV